VYLSHIILTEKLSGEKEKTFMAKYFWTQEMKTQRRYKGRQKASLLHVTTLTTHSFNRLLVNSHFNT